MDFLAAAQEFSAGVSILAAVPNLAFDHAAKILLPTLSVGGATWVGENAPIPVANGVAELSELTLSKLAAIVVLSNEIMQSSNVERLVIQSARKSPSARHGATGTTIARARSSTRSRCARCASVAALPAGQCRRSRGAASRRLEQVPPGQAAIALQAMPRCRQTGAVAQGIRPALDHEDGWPLDPTHPANAK
jgi:hypothetical protein